MSGLPELRAFAKFEATQGSAEVWVFAVEEVLTSVTGLTISTPFVMPMVPKKKALLRSTSGAMYSGVPHSV